MVIDPTGMVRLHNNSTERVFFTYHSRTFQIAPGKDGFVPFSLAQLYFGDPRSGMERKSVSLDGDKVGYIPSRIEEINRLATWYGVYDGNNIDGIKAAMTDVSAFSVEDGEQIIFPCDDPKCLQGLVDDPMSDSYIEQQMHNLKQQQLVLQQMMENREHEKSEKIAFLPEDSGNKRKPLSIPTDDNSDLVPEDSPNISIP